ncbi:TPA: hypothetical protein SFZ80_001608 [Campylobacter coli]|nr:hypothetical protein [Campylobacter coli]HEG8179732.1 hypothetical protein [Campylobacter jejuni]HEG8181344.1 hypothetical protein [Campylobacter coli]
MVVVCSDFNFDNYPKVEKLFSILNYKVYEKNGFKLYSLCVDSSIISSIVYRDIMNDLPLTLGGVFLIYIHQNLIDTRTVNKKYEEELEHKKTDCAFELILITFDSKIYDIDDVADYFRNYKPDLLTETTIAIEEFILDYKKERLKCK